MNSDHRDQLYASALDEIVNFRFDEAVAGVFPDMIQRSVPGYATVISMIGTLAATYARPHSRCYDLGCSVGAATLAMRRYISANACRIVAVDNAEAMVSRCRQNIDASDTGCCPVDLICADIRDISIEQASVVVLNYTLQFIAPEQRDAVIARIYAGLQPGGVLLVAEKIHFADPDIDQDMIELHHEFKRANGYSELEISQKRTALENVLIPETLGVHMERLVRAGFTTPRVWFQCLNFVSMIAVK
jgi:tRNA (cmo5U34)-methyltransferase